ncbi:hypothetical protein HZB01_02885 [Candidatus Woesearchaeota archaeon]|nr:hypothetical protein [Candidatus Woesearchaeota archaeon]
MAAKNIQFTPLELQIATYLFKHCKDKHNPRQLAKLLQVNHAHANKLCNQLAAKQILQKESIGNAVYYSYNYNNELALKFMEYVLSLEETEFPKSLLVLRHHLQKFKPFIQLGLVFGSSINSQKFNDIDILLMYTPSKAKKIAEIKDEIRQSQLIEQPIRYVDIAEKDIAKNKEDKVFYSIISDCIIFHNPGKYVEVIQTCRK